MAKLNINNLEVIGNPGQTILDVCRENNIDVPTLCHNELTEIYGACGLCVVEAEGNPKLLKACATEIADGMIIKTNTPRVNESRRTNLELLLSNHTGDCVAPCKRACPANTDCQGYVGLIANGEFDAALKLIREKIPLPAAIGRVCPHPCESKCRRGLVEEPISIISLKRFAADMDLALTGGYVPECAPSTGKSVAVVGGGPFGISAAYYLRRKGHSVTIIEAMPKLGGMLRYGIPEYRLPKALLNSEIELLAKMGVTFITNTKVGVDVTLESLRSNHDAVCIGIGAWVSTGTGATGEDLPGVIGGIDFLRTVERSEPINLGKRVAIVGGGNTAMDACRTAVRLGAETVYNIYRRTKDEMPADKIEIEEAEEEGVIFKNLTNPISYSAGANGKVGSVNLQIMELGEPDASGRRSPVPIEGKTETLDVDTVILAIGQSVNPSGFDGLELTRKRGIVYDPQTYMTSLPGVFAGGDCGNDKISIAIEAIADGEHCAEIVDAYLYGETATYKPRYAHERTDVTYESFEDRERIFRVSLETVPSEQRKDNFLEVVPNGFTPEQAIAEASRCLECGCGDYFECKLLAYSREYNVKPERFSGEKSDHKPEPDHPYIVRDMNKCILCGQCVRVCDEVVGASALGFVGRGFDTSAMPELELPLSESSCISCGNCVSVCPTGALQDRQALHKPIPLQTSSTVTTCPGCSVGCQVQIETHGDAPVRAVSPRGELLCHNRYIIIPETNNAATAIVEPLRGNGKIKSTLHDALIYTSKGLQRIQAKYGQDSIAISISPRLTNEEIYAIKKLADSIGAKTLSFSNSPNIIQKALNETSGGKFTPSTFAELAVTELVIAVDFDAEKSPVAYMKMRKASRAGVRTVLINPVTGYGNLNYASEIIKVENSADFLQEVLDAVNGGAQASEPASKLAKQYSSAKKAILVFQQNSVTPECAELIAKLALASGHIGSPREGILQIMPECNSRGLAELGITSGVEALDGVKGLLIFGENPEALPNGLEFLAVCDAQMTDTAKRADVVIPGCEYASADGSYTNTEGIIQAVRKFAPSNALPTWKIANYLANSLERGSNWKDVSDIAVEMMCK